MNQNHMDKNIILEQEIIIFCIYWIGLFYFSLV